MGRKSRWRGSDSVNGASNVDVKPTMNSDQCSIILASNLLLIWTHIRWTYTFLRQRAWISSSEQVDGGPSDRVMGVRAEKEGELHPHKYSLIP